MITAFIVSFFAGVTASMGLGGGFVLLIYLTAVRDLPQMQAGGVNLLFFLPVGLLSLIMHRKHGLVEREPLLPSITAGIGGVLAGVGAGMILDEALLSKLFALLILAVGMKEIFHPRKGKTSERG